MSNRAEMWTLGVGIPSRAVAQAERAEAAGWDGLALVDSQNLAGTATSGWPGPSLDADREEAARAARRFVEEVLPAC